MPGVDPDFEPSVRRWLRAYPRRWRVARGDEVLATLADLATPGATRLDRRSALGLLVGGVRTRVRTGPPLHQRIGYMFGRRTSPRYLAWMDDDLAAPISTAGFLVPVAVMGLSSVTWWLRHEDESALFVLANGIVMAIGDGTGPGRRAERRLRLLLPVPGDPGLGPRWTEGLVPRVRASARDVSAATAACLAWVTGSGIVAWWGAAGPERWPNALRVVAAPVLVGVVAAALARWRWRRWAGSAPDQSNRVVLRWRMRSTFLAVAVGAMAVWFGTDPSMSIVSAGMAVVSLTLLPATLAAWLWSLGAPASVAAVDLARVAATGRAPTRDERVRGAVPAGSPDARRGTRLIDLIRVDPDEPALG